MKLWLRQKQKFSWNIFQIWTEIAAKTKKDIAKESNFRIALNLRLRQKKIFFKNNFLMGMNLRLRHKKILSQNIL